MLIIGHRGCRGLFPENSIKAFKEAISLGVNAIELDVVVSEDREIVVSHEPFMSQTYCLKPNGEEIRDDEDKKI
jgi:glycerophosphoryl diester phosphodiesterase